MSSRDYYKQASRDALPPIRDVLGDQLDRPPHHESAYSFDAVHRALPSTTTTSSRSRSTWPQATGPTLPPIYHSHAPGYASAGPPTPSYSSSSAYPSSSPHPASHGRASSSHAYSQSSSSHRAPSQPQSQSQSQSGNAPYSFDVFRPSSAGLVHAASSSRSQGILRSTRADAGKRHALPPPLDDEDEHDDDGSKRYSCPHCGKRFSRPSSLKTHEIVHSDAKPYECSYPGCGKTFTVPSNMRRHYRKTHESSGGGGGGGSGGGGSGGHSGSGEDDGEEYASSSRYFQSSASASASARGQGSGSGSAHYYSSSRR